MNDDILLDFTTNLKSRKNRRGDKIIRRYYLYFNLGLIPIFRETKKLYVGWQCRNDIGRKLHFSSQEIPFARAVTPEFRTTENGIYGLLVPVPIAHVKLLGLSKNSTVRIEILKTDGGEVGMNLIA